MSRRLRKDAIIVERLRASVAQERATLKNLEARKSELLGTVKPMQKTLDDRDALLTAREQKVLAREEKVLAREEKVKDLADRIGSFTGLDA